MNPVAEADTRKTILVVDDTPDNLSLMAALLKDTYRVKLANGGEKALTICASASPPDLILLDIMMPGMSGYEVCQQLKDNPATASIPVIFLSALNDASDEKKGLDLGAVDFINKPISPEVALARVRTHLRLRELEELLRQRPAAT